MERAPLIVGFTGHRRVADAAGARAAIAAALRRLAAAAGGPLAAVSSAASGTDTLFAEAALAQGLAWTVLLPLPLAEFRKDFDAAGVQRLDALLPRAAATEVEPPQPTREDAYLACGRRTVDRSGAMIAFWDGNAAAGKGGTAEIVAYVRGQGKPLLWIHAATGAMTEERLDRLAAGRGGLPS
ncbi:MAG TPA: hypothetical protein VMD31_09790 [Opitutaceae bacterium]|nr:hypothetical protein [Opitutaceae bacterium]